MSGADLGRPAGGQPRPGVEADKAARGDRCPVGPDDAAVYVHFPYCARKCPYCDFNAHAISHDDRVYADAIIAELDARGPQLHAPAGLRSVFFGGGTPSRWDPVEVRRVIEAIRAAFGLRDGAEVTLEANPGTIAEDRFERFVEAGINRFSIGVQSLNDRELRTLGRIHDAAVAVRAVTAARATGARVSLDLMYGFPNQTWPEVLNTLERAIALGTSHVSAYALTVEPATVLGRQAAAGRFVPMPDDDQATLMERVHDWLQSAGLHRYEVSNYARPGAESRHNCLYWVGGAYLGLGAGAHSYLPAADLRAAVRRENRRAPEAYLRSAADRTFTPSFEEQLDPPAILADRLLTALRVRWGFDVGELDASFGGGGDIARMLNPALRELVAEGLLTRDGDRYRPTDRGFMLNDTLARRLRGRLDSAANPQQLQGVG